MCNGGTPALNKFSTVTTLYPVCVGEDIQGPFFGAFVTLISSASFATTLDPGYDYIQRNVWMTNDGFRDFMCLDVN